MKKILVAVDFSDASSVVVAAAVAMAKAFGSSINLVHVLEPVPAYTAYGFTPEEFPVLGSYQDEARRRAHNRLNALESEVSGLGLAVEAVILEGGALHEILVYSKEIDTDLLIVGTHGHGVMASVLLGTVADGLVRKSTIPILVIPVKK